MIFWDVEELKKQIRIGALTEWNCFKYLLLFLTINALGLELICYFPVEESNYWDYAASVLNVLVVFFGTIFAFHANGGKNGEKFLEKYLSIGFVISIRFLVYCIPVYILYASFYFYELYEINATLTEVVDLLPLFIWYSLMYWRIAVHIKKIRS